MKTAKELEKMFGITPERIAEIDARASQLGMRRSDYLRQLVDNELNCMGV